MNALLPFSPGSYPYVSSLVCAFFMCLTPLWIVISSKHPASRTLLYSGWEPVITAMVISRSVCVQLCVQLCVCVCNYVCLVFKGERTATLCLLLPVSGLLDDSSPKQSAVPKHIHPRVPLSLAAILIQQVGRDMIVSLQSLITKLENTNIGFGHHKL